jgi:hypothetical protein
MSENMNYCNSCGAPTGHAAYGPDRKAGRLFIIGGTAIGMTGLIAFFVVLGPILSTRLDPGTAFMMTLAYLASVVAMVTIAMTLGWKQLNQPGPKRQVSRDHEDYEQPQTFRSVTTSQLPEGAPPVASVTDSTTRTLDEVFVEARK